MADAATRVEVHRGAMASADLSRRCPTCGAHYPRDFLVCPKDATSLEQPANPDEDPLIGEVLAGSFMITGLLGAGGMGRVYEAEHVRLPRRFAVKVMHDQLANNAQAMARFEREAQAVARIVNDHVIDIVDVVRVQGRACIVTELLQGEELGLMLDREGVLPLPTAIAICRQVCRGLAAAHAAGVVHRDLKPSNLFLLPRDAGAPHVKVLDFGIAKLTDGADLTRTGMVLGTPAYMAPEQALGAGAVDQRADVYGVGAVLYRMLTGVPPFPDDDPARTLTRLITEDPRRPRDIVKSIPDGVEALIQRAMARAKEARPATVLELDKHLSAFEEPDWMEKTSSRMRPEGLGLAIETMATIVAEPPPQAAEDATKRARRTRPAALVLSIGASVIGGAAVLTTSAMCLRTLLHRVSFTEIETVLLALLTTLATILVLLGTMRVLITRWRSAPAMERLGEGLRTALLWFLVPLGVLALVVRAYATLAANPFTVAAPPKEYLSYLDLALALVPTLLGATMLTRGLRRAYRS
jgi:eukaryotic-like serine/threonine-protein kinase